MNESLFKQLVLAWIALAVILFPLLLKVKAPYGRHTSKKWGPLINNRAGWMLMELPSLILFATLALTGTLYGKLWLFFGVWILHYTNRIFVYPLRTRTRGKEIPLLIVLLATFFNLVNGFVNGYWLGHLAGGLEQGAAGSGPLSALIAGIILFAAGFLLNQVADNHLISLRKGKQGGYYIPSHPVFKYISCPNFLGEIIEWTGFALMTWSLPGLSFAIWTAVNLLPRALHHHRWYRDTFPDYPKERKALIPGIL